MINRDNKYVSIDRSSILSISNDKKRLIAAVSGVLLTVTLLTGCGSEIEKNTTSRHEEVEQGVIIVNESTEGIDLSSFDSDITAIGISYSDLVDVSELSNYDNLEVVVLDNNFITDINMLEDLPNLRELSITGNNVQTFDIENFEGLTTVYIEGNYNLYTPEIIEYCESHGINIDITVQDVENVNSIRAMVDSLDLEGKTDLEREQIICDFVCEHMTYDDEVYESLLSGETTNPDPLEGAVRGQGVCLDYATLFTSMCQLSGINAYQISGEANGSYNITSETEGHVWNLVEIDGQYMLCDPTWLDANIIDKMIGETLYYNVDGDKLEGFQKTHELTGVVSSLVEQSDITKVSSYEGIDQKIDNMFGNIDGIIENIEAKGISREDLTKMLLMGAAVGSVLLVSPKLSKKIKGKIEEAKQTNKIVEKPRKEKTKEIKTKQVVEEIHEEPTVEIPEVKQEVKEEKKADEQILSSLPTVQDKINYLEEKSSEALKEAATMQVELEIENKDMDKFQKEEKIEEAMQEIVGLSLQPKDERALFRCKKYGYIPMDMSLEDLDKFQKESLEATKRIYSEVDSKTKEYLKLYLEKLKLQNSLSDPNDLETVSSMKKGL